jgi:hypothetical protein
MRDDLDSGAQVHDQAVVKARRTDRGCD